MLGLDHHGHAGHHRHTRCRRGAARHRHLHRSATATSPRRAGVQMTASTRAPSVFEAGLPALEYDVTESPQQVCARIRAAQRRAPIAIGPFGPEVLSYELARNLLRDNRFVIPPGLHLSAQGVTSGPLWDRVVGQHHLCGRRRTPSVAEPGITGIHAPGDRASGRNDRRSGQRSDRRRRRRGPLRHRHRYRPALSHSRSSVHCLVPHAQIGRNLNDGPKNLQDGQLLGQSSTRKCRPYFAVGPSSTPMSMRWSPNDDTI